MVFGSTKVNLDFDRIEKLVASDPACEKSSFLWHWLGNKYLEREDEKKAFGAFKKAFENDSANIEALCEILNLAGKNPSLAKEFDEKKSSLFGKILGLFGSNKSDAIKNLEERVRLSEAFKVAEPPVFLGDIYREEGELEKAYDAYRKGISYARKENQLNVRTVYFDPKEWGIGTAILKTYDPADIDKANNEFIFINEGAKFKDMLKLPDGRPVKIPESCYLLKKSNAPESPIIERLPRLSGYSAYDYLVKMPKNKKVKFLETLVDAAAALDDFYTVVVPENSEVFRNHFSLHGKKKVRQDFFSNRIKTKFFEPLEQRVRAELPFELKRELGGCLNKLDLMFSNEMPDWLVSIRLNHDPMNYLVCCAKKPANDVSLDDFNKEATLCRIDFENNYLCYSSWDILSLLRRKEDVFLSNKVIVQLALRYVISRLNLHLARNGFEQAKLKRPDEILQGKNNDFMAFNAYLADSHNYLKSKAADEKKYDYNSAVTHFHWFGFLRNLELIGLYTSRQKDAAESRNYAGPSIESLQRTKESLFEYMLSHLDALSGFIENEDAKKIRAIISKNRDYCLQTTA